MRSIWLWVAISCGFVSLAAGPSQGPALASVMHQKLAHAQKLLEAVVTSDWVALESHTRELEQLTLDRRWMALNYPEYAQHGAAFVGAVQALHQAATRRDLEESSKAYVAVTLACVNCHQYLARQRMARPQR
jgi:cytochrome c556